MVSIADVREILGNIDTSLLSDSQINKAINDAIAFVEKFITSSNSLYDQCVKYRAAYLSLVTYAEIARREVGDLPTDAKLILDQLKTIADEFLETARKIEDSSSSYTVSYPVTVTVSRWDEHDW